MREGVKASQVQELKSPGGAIRCVRFGRVPGQYVAMGSNDKLVKVYRVRQSLPVVSFTDRDAPVTSLSFSPHETSLVCGTSIGHLNLWDIQKESLVRSYNCGHTQEVTTVDHHPNSETYFVSGSVDANVYVWDLRKRSSLQAYKGHAAKVNVVRFSPDGRWVASGDAVGTVKLWDIAAGKCLAEFQRHEGEILCLDYHPVELLLGAGSADRTVATWELDSFSLVTRMQPDHKGVRAVKFHSGGQHLFSATQEKLTVSGWEPPEVFSQCEAPWSDIRDLVQLTSTNELLGAAFVDQTAGVWSVPLPSLKPFSTADGGAAGTASGSAPLPLGGVGGSSSALAGGSSSSQVGGGVKPPAFGSPQPLGVGGGSRPSTAARPSPSSAAKGGDARPASAGVHDVSVPEHLMGTRVVHIGQTPVGLDVQAWADKAGGGTSDSSAEAVLSSLSNDSAYMQRVMHGRLSKFKLLHTLWRKDRAAAVEHCATLDDAGVLADFVSHVVKSKGLALETAGGVVGLLPSLLRSTFESQLLCGMDAAVFLWDTFSDVITSTVSAGGGRGVDVERDARLDRCRTLCTQMIEIRSVADSLVFCASSRGLVEPLASRADTVGERSRMALRKLSNIPRLGSIVDRSFNLRPFPPHAPFS